MRFIKKLLPYTLPLLVLLLTACGGGTTDYGCDTADVKTLAGSGRFGDLDGMGAVAEFSPQDVTSDGTNVYLADDYSNKIRKIVIATGEVTTLAGSGVAGDTDGTGAAATFDSPSGITTDGTYVYVSDTGNHKIRKIDIATGEVTTLAGSGAWGGADGMGTAATFNYPHGVAIDGTNLYVMDAGNYKVRKIDIATGEVTTLAGSGAPGATDGIGTVARFGTSAKGIASDGTNLYVADLNNHKIRKIVIATGVVSTLAGSGSVGYNDAIGAEATFSAPHGVATDGTNVYVADTDNNKIRKIVIATGKVTTLAGSSGQSGGYVDGPGDEARFQYPLGITTDGANSTDGVNLYVADWSNNRVRKVRYLPGVCSTPVSHVIGGDVTGLNGTLVLQNGANDKTITANGVFAFSKKVSTGKSYNVTVKTQPTGQTCTVSNGSGTADANIDNIAVSCVDDVLLPDAPAGVSATAGDGQVSLSWTAVSGASSYNVYYGTSAGVTTMSGTKVAGVTSGNAITGLTNSTPYYFIVTAVGSGGESIASSEVNATPHEMQAPTVSASPAGTNFTSSVAVTLTCADTGGSGCAASYYTDDGVTTPTTSSSVYSTPISISSTTTLMFFSVDNASNASAVQTETYTLVPPVAPAVTPAAGEGLVTLSWSAVTDASSYNVYYGTGTGVTTMSGTKVAGVTSGSAITSLTNGTPYYFIVTSVGSGGESSASSEVTATPVDNTAPLVSSTTPTDTATGVARGSSITATFNEDILAATVDGTSFTLSDGSAISGSVSFNAVSNVATFTPDSRLMMLSAYDATLSTSITDLAGNPLAADYTWSFTTADGSWSSVDVLENTDDTSGARVVMDSNGNAIAVWRQGAPSIIQAKRYVVGSGWDATAQQINSGTDDADLVDIAMDSNGNAIAVWQQFDSSFQLHVWANRYDIGTNTWGTAVQIDTGGGDAGQPAIAIDSSGNAMAVWSESDGFVANLWARPLPAGGSWGTAVKIENDDTGDAGYPSIVFDPSGNAIVVWEQYDGSFISSAWTNRYVSGSWGTAETIESDNVNDAVSVEVAVDGSGNAIATWVQWDGTVINAWANRYTAGGSWGTAQTITDGSGDVDSLGPRIDMDGSGNAMVVWAQSDGFVTHIWTNSFAAGSSSWGTATALESGTYNALNAQIAADTRGNAVAVWRQVDDLTRFSTWACRYVVGSGWSAPEKIETDDAGENIQGVEIDMDANGDAIAIWNQWDGGILNNNSVWANRFE